MWIRTPALGLLGAVVVSATATAADLSSVTLKDDSLVVVLSGDIADGDADAAEALIKSANDRGRLVEAVRLDSLGGSLAEAVKLTELIRRAKLPTIVAAGSRCASACFIVFAAGIDKFASYDAAIGVHGASDSSGHETARTEAATLSMARLAGTFGVPPRIIAQMIATPARDIAWLTPDDLRAMGAIMTGRKVRSAPPALGDGQQLAALDLPPGGAAPPSPTADDGIAHAQLSLGIAYALGRGVPYDLVQGYKWLSLAASAYTTGADRSRAIEARDLVATKMTSQEITEAQRLARDWDRQRNTDRRNR